MEHILNWFWVFALMILATIAIERGITWIKFLRKKRESERCSLQSQYSEEDS